MDLRGVKVVTNGVIMRKKIRAFPNVNIIKILFHLNIYLIILTPIIR